jgi:N-6 DNA Methylase
MYPDAHHILNPLDQIAARGQPFSRVYADWLTMSCCAFTGGKQEELYEATLDSYRDARRSGDSNRDLFAKALAGWLHAMKEADHRGEFRDYLGHIFQERVTRGEKGQFFTPEGLCTVLAELTGPIEPGARVNDPACGSGRALMAAASKQRHARFTGSDLDMNCVRMTALNMLVRNVDGWVVHANAISLESWGGYRFRHSFAGGELEPISAEDAKALMEAPLRAAETRREAEQEKQRAEPAPALEKAAEPDKAAEKKPVKEQMGFGF